MDLSRDVVAKPQSWLAARPVSKPNNHTAVAASDVTLQ